MKKGISLVLVGLCGGLLNAAQASLATRAHLGSSPATSVAGVPATHRQRAATKWLETVANGRYSRLATAAASPLPAGAAFTLPGQIEIAVTPPFNHTPIPVPVTAATTGVNLSNLVVTSDAGWVKPSLDAARGTIVLSFTTSNLVNSLYTATISASLSGATNTMFVRAYVSPLNLFKLKDDPRRSRTYGIQQNGLTLGSVVIVDPVTTNYIGNVTVGNKPSDLAISSDGQELLVINCVDESISVIDLNTLALKQTLTLPLFDNWGQDSTTANLAVGPGNILYYTDGAWAPALRVLNRTTMQVLQTVYSQGSSGDGWGDIGLTSDKRLLFGWMQYGWSAGLAGSYVTRFAVASTGLLTFLDQGPSQYSALFARDPLETPVLVSSDDQTIFIKGFALGTNAASNVKFTFPGPVYSISPGGEIAVSATAIYETRTGIKLADLPRSAPVQTISSDYARLIYFDTSARSLQFLNLLDLIGPGILNRDIVPADKSISLSPPQLKWSPLPGVDRYRVYLGPSQAAVAAATTNSPLFLGEAHQSFFPLTASLTPGATYFWRVDAVTEFDVTPGEVYEFTVSMVSSSLSEINARTVQGHATYRSTFSLQSQTPGTAWQASANRPWVSFTQVTGTTPATVELTLNAAALTSGIHQASVTISSGTNALFSLPITLTVDPLKLTVLRSDPISRFVYAISEEPTAIPARAYLLEIDTASETIQRVVPVGSSATDLAVHNGDNRIYVPNWLPGSLLAIDKTSFQVARAYTFAPFGGTGYSEGDVYRVAAGAPGRLVWEEEDQWINISLFNTAAGTNLGSAFVREGGGAFGPGGRYYYHGDNNSSGAEIHKFDVTGDKFTELAHIRVASVSYYGSRTVVVSEDGSRVFWNGSVFNANLAEEWTIADEIFSASADGRYAFSQTKVYDIPARQAVLGMPTDTTVSAFNSSTRKLVLQTGGALGFYPLTDPLSLPAPVLSAALVAYNSVTLKWTDRSLENSFTLQRRVAGSTTWEDLGSLARNTMQYTVPGLASQTTYEFRIKAEASTLSSDWSPILTVTTPGMPPATPALNLPVAGLYAVSLSWSNPTNETAFVLERSVNSTTNWSVLATLAADLTAYMDTNVVKLTTYYYRVKATNSFGESAYSAARGVTVPAPQPPAAPSGLIAKPLTTSRVLIAWNEVLDETGYRLERRTENPNSWAVVVTLPANTTSYTDTNLVQGMQYFYRVQAFNTNGVSPYSNEGSAIPANIVYVFQDDFDPNLDPTMWASISGGVATNGIQGFRGSQALYFAGAGPRSATTIPLEVAQGGTLEFFIRAGNESLDGNLLWNNSESGETVVLEYCKDGVNWVSIQTINTVYPALTTWAAMSVAIPSGASGARTQFRWRQLANSGPEFDCWALEDVRIQGIAPTPPAPVPFAISSAGSASSITLFWVGADRAAAYQIERRTDTQPWSAIASVSALTTYYTDAGLLPGQAYTYRVTAVNAGGSAAPSMPTTSATWTPLQQWVSDNYGNPNALSQTGLTTPGTDGIVPLLRYAFNLTAQEPIHPLQPGGTGGAPAVWVDSTRNRLCVDFVRRKATTNPGIAYQVEFGGTLTNWSVASQPISMISLDSTWERVRYEDTLLQPQATARFYRVTVRPE